MAVDVTIRISAPSAVCGMLHAVAGVSLDASGGGSLS